MLMWWKLFSITRFVLATEELQDLLIYVRNEHIVKCTNYQVVLLCTLPIWLSLFNKSIRYVSTYMKLVIEVSNTKPTIVIIIRFLVFDLDHMPRFSLPSVFENRVIGDKKHNLHQMPIYSFIMNVCIQIVENDLSSFDEAVF